MKLYERIAYLSNKKVSSELTVSNNSLRVVTEKYFCLTLLYCWHSKTIWTNRTRQTDFGYSPIDVNYHQAKQRITVL